MRIKKRIHQKPKSTRTFVLIVFLGLFLSALFLAKAFYAASITIARDEFVTNMDLTLGQIAGSISQRLRNVEEIQNLIASNENILQYLSEDPQNETLYQQYKNFQEMTNTLNGFYNNHDIDHISLYVNHDKLYANQYSDFYPLSEILSQPAGNTAIANPGRCIWDSFSKNGGANTVSCCRAVISIKNYDHIAGVSVINVSEAVLYAALSDIKVTDARDISLVHEDGRIVSNHNKSRIGEAFSPSTWPLLMASGAGFIETQRNGEEMILIARQIDGLPWRIVIEFPSSQILRQSRYFNSVVSIVIVIFIVIAGMLVMLFSLELFQRQTVNRIRKISNSIELAGIGDIIAPPKAVDRLDAQVSAMARIILDQMSELYSNEIKVRDAQFNALQAQINPHFLYNTLDTIHWMALEHQAYDISNILDLLAKYFRLSLSKGQGIVSIRDEISLVQAYGEIQRIRFDDSFSITCSVDERLLDCRIPKLVFQPIVENSILHGVQGLADRRGEIKLTITDGGDILLIVIEDNGEGMDETEYNALIQTIRCGDGLDHYGLHNVDERLAIFSGKYHRMEMVSQKGQGTKTTIHLRKVWEDHA